MEKENNTHFLNKMFKKKKNPFGKKTSFEKKPLQKTFENKLWKNTLPKKKLKNKLLTKIIWKLKKKKKNTFE